MVGSRYEKLNRSLELPSASRDPSELMAHGRNREDAQDALKKAAGKHANAHPLSARDCNMELGLPTSFEAIIGPMPRNGFPERLKPRTSSISDAGIIHTLI